MEAMEVMLSTRNRPLFVRGNYKFSFHKNLKHGVQRWKCINSKGCTAYIKFSSEFTVLEAYDGHNHPPLDETILNRERISNRLKMKAEDDVISPPSKLVKQELQKGDTPSIRLSDISLVKRNIRRARRQRFTKSETKLDEGAAMKKLIEKYGKGMKAKDAEAEMEELTETSEAGMKAKDTGAAMEKLIEKSGTGIRAEDAEAAMENLTEKSGTGIKAEDAEAAMENLTEKSGTGIKAEDAEAAMENLTEKSEVGIKTKDSEAAMKKLTAETSEGGVMTKENPMLTFFKSSLDELDRLSEPQKRAFKSEFLKLVDKYMMEAEKQSVTVLEK